MTPIVHTLYFILRLKTRTAMRVRNRIKTRLISAKTEHGAQFRRFERITEVSIKTAGKSTLNICTASHFAASQQYSP